MKSIGWALGAFLAVAVGAVAAEAQQGGPRTGMGGGMGLARADANGDGQITREEARTARTQMFARLDSNGDGFISQEERQARAQNAQARRGRMLERVDADNDGKISRSEFSASPMPGFDRADSNHNGVVEASELAAVRAARAAKHEKHE